MKRWPVVRIGLIAVAAAGLGFFGYHGYEVWLFLKDAKPCERHSRIVAVNPAGDQVLFQETFCAGPAFSNGGTLSLVRKRDGAARMFLEYEELDADPIVRWVGDDRLVVSIEQVDHVFTQKRAADGVRIEYRIGRIATH